jgi:hypothetical protein
MILPMKRYYSDNFFNYVFLACLFGFEIFLTSLGVDFLTKHHHHHQVSRAKTQLKANMLMQLDSFSQTAEDIGRQMLTYGRRMSNAEVDIYICIYIYIYIYIFIFIWAEDE